MKCEKPLGRVIFKYNGYTKELKKGFRNGLYHCDEEDDINYLNPGDGRVLIGDLITVTNVELKYNMKFGTKCNLKRIVTRNIAIKHFSENVDILIQKFV